MGDPKQPVNDKGAVDPSPTRPKRAMPEGNRLQPHLWALEKLDGERIDGDVESHH